jgi:glycerophosphoryl diester phosphodiesterase
MKIELWHRLIRPEPWRQGLRTMSPAELPSFQMHRGSHKAGQQENTLNAFREAKKLGAEMCECDVQLSRDDIPVIFHDYDLKRLGGRPDQLKDLTVAELKSAAQICTLEEVLTDPQVPEKLNIELKTRRADDPLSRKVSRVVENVHAEKRVIFSSFNPFALWMMQDYLPEVPRALLVSEEKADGNSWWLRKMLSAPILKIHMLNLEQSMLDVETIQFWNKKKMPISAWTVNDRERARDLLNQGVRSIISDVLISSSS